MTIIPLMVYCFVKGKYAIRAKRPKLLGASIAGCAGTASPALTTIGKV